MKVSVVISSFNEEGRIEDCLKSVTKIANEIIFIDNSSTDKTASIARKYTDKVFIRENNPMLNVNKNFGFSKATGKWILSLDSDERIDKELEEEILSLPEESTIDGYFIPRKNIIFGKWIEHTGWYPDYQLRLFKKNKGSFAEQQVHEMLTIEGTTGHLKNPMNHINYENISQFLNKMIKTYTASEAEHLVKEGYRYQAIDIVKMPLSEFIKRYFAEKGYLDGMHGLTLSLLQAFYHFVVFLRLWEMNNYKEVTDSAGLLTEGARMVRHEFLYWGQQKNIESEKNTIKKQFYKVKRKILS